MYCKNRTRVANNPVQYNRTEVNWNHCSNIFKMNVHYINKKLKAERSN